MAEKHCNHCASEKQDSFAMELLKGYSAQAKRWFIIAIIELAIILSIIGGAIYFLTTSEFSYTELSTDGGGNANFIQESTLGDINNGESKE